MMKLLIKIFITVIVVLFLLMVIPYFWGRPLLEKAGSLLLQENIVIDRVCFIPHRLSFQMQTVRIPGKNVVFPQGVLRLIPLQLECSGIRFADKISLQPGGFSLNIRSGRAWQVAVAFTDISLSRLDGKFGQGEIQGKIEGGYDKGLLDLYGVVRLTNLSYNDNEGSFLDISPETLQDLLQNSGGQLSLDFIYQGPVDKMDELYRYRPGPKTLDLLRTYFAGAAARSINKKNSDQEGI